ncbi:MAG: hypothetical protein ACI4FN_04510 [Acutalibacteraceae bacterium]
MADVFIKFQNHSLYIDNLRYFLEYKPAIDENEAVLSGGKYAEMFLKQAEKYNK